jgi:glycosyltransferase involved in cell wall biosynthesis
MNPPYRLTILNSHPIQYFAPLYRRIAQDPEIDLTVYYCSRQGVEEYADAGFGQSVKWDVPLLEGYNYKFLPNLIQRDKVGGMFSLVNLGVASEIAKHRFDALWVHGHNYITYLLAIAVAKMTGTRTMMRCETHLMLECPAWKRNMRSVLMRAFYRSFDGFLPIGTNNADFYRYHGVPERKLFTVPYTVDNNFFAQEVRRYRNEIDSVKQELGIHDDGPVILFASKFSKRKHPMDVLVAYHNLVMRGIQAHLVFVGSGEEEARLRAYSQEHALSQVHFLGFQNQSLLPKFYALADIFVLPSENEPWGLIINEVMCAGLPIVTTDKVGAVADLVRHGENGFLYEAGDILLLTNHLLTLCTDRELRTRAGARSFEIIQNWSYDQCVEGIKRALAYTSSRKN